MVNRSRIHISDPAGTDSMSTIHHGLIRDQFFHHTLLTYIHTYIRRNTVEARMTRTRKTKIILTVINTTQWIFFKPFLVCFQEAITVSSESEDEEMPGVGGSKGKHDLLVKAFENKAGQSRFFKSNKKQYPMFPFHETKIKYDEYGEVIRWVNCLT